MKKNRRKVFMAAGYNTVSLGTGRKEFHPKKPRPGLEEYIQEAGRGTLTQIGGGKNVDEGRHRQFHGRPLQQAGQPGGPHPLGRPKPAMEAMSPGRRAPAARADWR